MNTPQSAHENLWQRMRRCLAHWLWSPLPTSNWQASKTWGIDPVSLLEKPGLPPWGSRPLLEITPVRLPAVSVNTSPMMLQVRQLSIRQRAYCRQCGIPLPPALPAPAPAPKPTRLPLEQRREILRKVYAEISTVTPSALAELPRPQEDAWLNSGLVQQSLAEPIVAKEVRVALFGVMAEDCVAADESDDEKTKPASALLRLKYCEHEKKQESE